MQKEKWVEETEVEFYKNLERILEQSEKDFQEGRFHEAREVFKELREKYNY